MAINKNTPKTVRRQKKAEIGEMLLRWYDKHARTMPWRSPPPNFSHSPQKANPYHVFLSEVMLQQTQVATVKDYFTRFIMRWPTVEDLAKTSQDEVMAEWAGLGYYSRARNLKKTAEIITEEFSGSFPQDYETLIKLPGIGDYTASAISSIAFQQPVAVVDGNVERIITRLEAIDQPLPKAKPLIKTRLIERVGKCLDQRSGDLAQSFMDLGATLCTAKNPKCEACPIQEVCKAYAQNRVLDYPKKLAKKPKPTRKGACFLIQTQTGALWLEKRPQTGMLAEMSAPPSTDWHVNGDGKTGIEAVPFQGKWQELGQVKHTFTHFHLLLDVYGITCDTLPNEMQQSGWWSNANQRSGEAIPTLFTKAIKLIEG